jgi:hypothetical protein
MTNSVPPPSESQPRDAAYWAQRVAALKVGEVPAGARNLNVEGRQVVGPLQGFGALWQKTYRIRFPASVATPAEVVAAWKTNFSAFQPPENHFFTSQAGVLPGEVVLINASMMGSPIDTGTMVLYADDESFTLMTPQGHPESGWITFSAFEDDGSTVAQIQSMARANDPIYELGFRLFASGTQEKIWSHVLRSLAAHFGVTCDVDLTKTCVDRKVQWRQAGNVWHNAAARSTMYMLLRPLRSLQRRLRGQI